jgi:hypothetical protein
LPADIAEQRQLGRPAPERIFAAFPLGDVARNT